MNEKTVGIRISRIIGLVGFGRKKGNHLIK